MYEQRRLLNGGKHHAAGDEISDFGYGSDVPEAFTVDHVYRGSRRYVHTLFFEQRVQRTSDSVKEAAYQSRSKLNGEGFACAGHILIDAQSVSVLVDLDGGVVSIHLYYFAHQLMGPDLHDFAHSEVAHAVCLYDGAVDKFDGPKMGILCVIF